uniref:Uncharacterized protein n=1 Tax=Theileria annulata TaxID=5874 RepID=A0A3B0MUJ2_THEAN
MNITTFLMLSFSVVSCVNIEDVSDDPLTLFDPLESGGALSQYDDLTDFDFSKELSPLDEDVETDLDELDSEETPSDEHYDTEIKDATRLSCPFSGKNCRFKKAKCRCSSKDGDFKFTMKKFAMTGDDKTEEPESPEEQQELPKEHTDVHEQSKQHFDTHDQSKEHTDVHEQSKEHSEAPKSLEQQTEPPKSLVQQTEPTPKEIVQQVPEMIEGFKMLEDLNDPSQLVLGKAQDGTVSEQPSNDSGLQMVPTTGGQDEFEDKTIRVRTEDKKDKDKKVHEYEYLRVKKVDNKNGIKETHLESPKSQNPSVMYHKGAIPKMDLSVKSRISSVFPPKVDEQAPAPEAIEHSQPLAIEYPQHSTTDNSKPLAIEYPQHSTTDNSKPLAIEYPQHSTTDNSKPLAIEYPQHSTTDNSKPLAIEYPQHSTTDNSKPLAIEYPQHSTTGEEAPRKLAEVKQHKQESSQTQSMAVKPFNKDLTVQKFKPVVTQGLKKPVGPPTPKFVSLSYPGEVTDLTAGNFREGARLRSLKKNKSKKSKGKASKGKKAKKAKKAKKSKKPKKTKEQKLAEKEKKKEMKKKKKLSNEQAEKNQNAILEKMREKDRFLGEKLEKEKEELEKKQESGAAIAKRVRQLQIEKDRQEKKIKLAEKRIQAKKDLERKAEKAETLKQLKKEKELLREQEKQLDDMKVDSVDGDHESGGEDQLLEKNSSDDTDDSTNL